MISFVKYIFSALKIVSFKSYDVRQLLIYLFLYISPCTEVFRTVAENIREGFSKFNWGSLRQYLSKALEGRRVAPKKMGYILLILRQ